MSHKAMLPVEKNVGKAWGGPQGCGHQESRHLKTPVLAMPATCLPPPTFLQPRIQIRFRPECFSVEYLFMWYIFFEVHHSMLTAAGLREVLFFYFF